MVQLREILQPAGDAVSVTPAEEFELLGVKSFGRGAFPSAVIRGSDTAYKRLYRVTAGQVVYPKLMAWEGAFAVVPEELNGRLVSPEFQVFDIDERAASSRYLRQLLSWAGFLRWVRSGSSGTNVRRQRLSPSDFLDIRVPLPSRDQQEVIVRHLESLERSAPLQPTPEMSGPVYAHTLAETDWLARFPSVKLSELVTVGPKPERVPPGDEVVFVPMDAVSAMYGTISRPRYVLREAIASGYRQFANGDILFARITPSMQNGKSAIFDDPRGRIGYGSTEFHVLRPFDPAQGKWIWGVLRTRWFRRLAAESFTGTAGQQRVPASFLKDVALPVPLETESSESLRRLLHSQETLSRLLAVESHRDSLRSSILPAARNGIFAAMA